MNLTSENIVMLALVGCQFHTITTIAARCEEYGMHRQEVATCIFDLWQAGILKKRGEGIDGVQYALRKRFAGEVQKLAAQAAEQPKPVVEAVTIDPANYAEDISVRLAARIEDIKEPILNLMADGKSRDCDEVAHDLGFVDPVCRFATKKALNQLSRRDSPLIRKKGKVFSQRPPAKPAAPTPADLDIRELDYLSVLNQQARSESRDTTAHWENVWNQTDHPKSEPRPAFDAETLEKMQSIVLYELRGGVRQAAGELFWLVQSNIPSVRELGANFALLLKEEARKADGLIRYDSESVPSGYALSEAGVAFMGQQPPTPEALRARQYAENLMRPPARPGLNQALAKPYLPAVHSGLVEVMQCGSEQRVVLKGQLQLTLRAAAALRDELQRLCQPFSFWRQYAYGGGMIKETTSIKGVEFTTNELEHVLRRLNAMNFPNN